jgi:TatD DNase family protein
MLIDSHVHLASYDSQEVSEIVRRASGAKVEVIITASTTLESSRRSVELARIFPTVYAGIGIHPNRLRDPLPPDAYDALSELAASSPRVVAISETGLDFLPNAPDRGRQEEAFRLQLRLARELGLPVNWHSQVPEPGVPGLHGETLRVLKEEGAGELGGVMHYFQADESTAWAAIEGGFYVSFSKTLLRHPHLPEVARRIPLEHVVLETDAGPQPWKEDRTDWTEPKDIPLIAERLAELKGVTVDEVARVTTANLKRLHRLDG